ncbi:MAG: HAMP domain-containing protein [Nitrospirae bacterium]|nr:HAMP domain-containing protein [Nitrospirota bacterium]
MRLRTKVLIFFVLVTFSSAGLVIWFSMDVVHDILIEEVVKRGLLKTQDLPDVTVSGFRAGNEPLLLPVLQAGLEHTGAIYAMALDPTGLVLAHTNVVEKDKVYRDPVTASALRSDRPSYKQIIVNGQPVMDIGLPVWAVQEATSGEEFLLFGGKELKATTRLGTLRLGLPVGDVLQTIDRISGRVMIIMTVSGGAVLLITLFFMRRILFRVRVLTQGTERIGRGEYGTTVPVLASDELGNLAESFNRMSQDMAFVHQNLEDQVKTRTQELEAFVYTISHDLKSPVVSMQGMASMFLEDYGAKVDEKGKHYLERVMANAEYMEKLINDLLTLSRIGRKQENPERGNLHEILQEILDIHKEHFKEKKIEVVIQSTLPHFEFGRGHLAHVLQNLFTNAAKFMGNQSHPRIEVGGKEAEDWVEFYVKDNGIGIDPEYHEKIFGIFQRLKEVEVEGTGVGLSIVKKIVDLAGGKIWVESKKGKGATFFLRLPRK